MTYIEHDNFKMELISDGLSFPSSIAFDNDGVLYVAESGVPFDGQLPVGRICKIGNRNSHDILTDDLGGPVNGLTFHNDKFYISENRHGGSISEISRTCEKKVIVDGLPGPGNYHTNMVAIGPDNKLYFSQGAMTNTGVVGLDSYELGWLHTLPHSHDIPGYDIVLSGINFETVNPLHSDKNLTTKTGAFVQFGVETSSGQHVSADLPCTASIMRCAMDGRNLELVAWGLRNAYGLGFLPDGRLIATEQGPDDRGSRPVGNTPDLLFEIKQGSWYGWPDFVGGDPITNHNYRPKCGDNPGFVVANHSELPEPEKPLVRIPSNSCPVKFETIPVHMKEHAGHIAVVLFGDEKPITAPAGPRVGRNIVCLDPLDWSVHSFINGPFFRPIDIRLNPRDGSLYILDFGQFEMDGFITRAKSKSGKVWRLDISTR
jgi:Glucose / Sorbosone dehydrogenase